jgi:single-stranded DNA-binding protein
MSEQIQETPSTFIMAMFARIRDAKGDEAVLEALGAEFYERLGKLIESELAEANEVVLKAAIELRGVQAENKRLREQRDSATSRLAEEMTLQAENERLTAEARDWQQAAEGRSAAKYQLEQAAQEAVEAWRKGLNGWPHDYMLDLDAAIKGEANGS